MIDPQESKLPELEENSSFGFGGRMLPATLNRGNANGELYVDSNNTPLRAGMTRLPRLRLLDKYFKVETVPVYVNRKDRTNPVRSFIVHRWKHDGMIGSERCSVDRFIPRRKGQNREAAYHSLVRAPPKKPCGRALDFPVDVRLNYP